MVPSSAPLIIGFSFTGIMCKKYNSTCSSVEYRKKKKSLVSLANSERTCSTIPVTHFRVWKVITCKLEVGKIPFHKFKEIIIIREIVLQCQMQRHFSFTAETPKRCLAHVDTGFYIWVEIANMFPWFCHLCHPNPKYSFFHMVWKTQVAHQRESG